VTISPAVIRLVLLGVVVLAAAAFDWRTRRIPNALTLTGIAAGLVLWIVTGTVREFAMVFLSVIAVIAIGMFLQGAGVIGGGDTKLVAAVAAIAGPGLLGRSLFWTLVAGILVSVVLLARKRALLPLLRRAGQAGKAALWRLEREPVVVGPGHRIPYALVIALGVIAAVVFEQAGLRWPV
jgi:prepilin peptidase CpaA